MTHHVDWAPVTAEHVHAAIAEYDKLGPAVFYQRHGFAPTTTYQLLLNGAAYPPKALLGTAYELATGTRLAPIDFEGGRAGAVKILTGLGFTVEPRVR